jgi:hypothetical protein
MSKGGGVRGRRASGCGCGAVGGGGVEGGEVKLLLPLGMCGWFIKRVEGRETGLIARWD